MWDLLRDLSSDNPLRADVRLAEVAPACRLRCCKAACQSNYLFYLEENVTLAVANAADLGVDLGTVCADVVDSLNAIVKRAYSHHTARLGGVPGATALQREAQVALQAWGWWVLQFDLPLRHHPAPHTGPCTMAKLMATQSPLPSTFSLPRPPLVSPPHGLRNVKAPLWGPCKSPRLAPGMLALLVFLIPCALIFR